MSRSHTGHPPQYECHRCHSVVRVELPAGFWKDSPVATNRFLLSGIHIHGGEVHLASAGNPPPAPSRLWVSFPASRDSIRLLRLPQESQKCSLDPSPVLLFTIPLRYLVVIEVVYNRPTVIVTIPNLNFPTCYLRFSLSGRTSSPASANPRFPDSSCPPAATIRLQCRLL